MGNYRDSIDTDIESSKGKGARASIGLGFVDSTSTFNRWFDKKNPDMSVSKGMHFQLFYGSSNIETGNQRGMRKVIHKILSVYANLRNSPLTFSYTLVILMAFSYTNYN